MVLRQKWGPQDQHYGRKWASMSQNDPEDTAGRTQAAAVLLPSNPSPGLEPTSEQLPGSSGQSASRTVISPRGDRPSTNLLSLPRTSAMLDNLIQ